MRLIYIALFCFLALSCSETPGQKKRDSFKQFPADSSLLAYISQKTAALNLFPIQQGVDSFELRVWHGIGMVKPQHLSILRYSNGRWQAFYTDYWLNYVNNDQ